MKVRRTMTKVQVTEASWRPRSFRDVVNNLLKNNMARGQKATTGEVSAKKGARASPSNVLKPGAGVEGK